MIWPISQHIEKFSRSNAEANRFLSSFATTNSVVSNKPDDFDDLLYDFESAPQNRSLSAMPAANTCAKKKTPKPAVPKNKAWQITVWKITHDSITIGWVRALLPPRSLEYK